MSRLRSSRAATIDPVRTRRVVHRVPCAVRYGRSAAVRSRDSRRRGSPARRPRAASNSSTRCPPTSKFGDLPQQSNIYSSDGTLIAQFYIQNRVVVPLEDISPWMQKAIVAVEDKRFWEHNGVDGQGLLARRLRQPHVERQPGRLDPHPAAGEEHPLPGRTGIAARTSARRRSRRPPRSRSRASFGRRGYALTSRPSSRRNTAATARTTPKVDCGKEKILEQYLNIAQFGASVYGVETASQLYFGHSAKEDNAIEAATIVGITQNPFKWDPLMHEAAAETRRNTCSSRCAIRACSVTTRPRTTRCTRSTSRRRSRTRSTSTSRSSAAPPRSTRRSSATTSPRSSPRDPAFEGKGEEWLKEGVEHHHDARHQHAAHRQQRPDVLDPPDRPVGVRECHGRAGPVQRRNPRHGPRQGLRSRAPIRPRERRRSTTRRTANTAVPAASPLARPSSPSCSPRG